MNWSRLMEFSGVEDNGALSCGICCSELDDSDRLKWSRFSKVRIKAEVVTNGPNAPNNDIKIAIQEVAAFDAGPNEDGTAQGFVDAAGDSVKLTDADTDARSGGALAPRGCAFKAYGISFEVEQPLALFGAADSVVVSDQITAVYAGPMRELLSYNLIADVDVGFSKCEYDLGLIGAWPPPGAPRGDQFNLTSGLAGLVEKLGVVICFTDRDADRKPTIELKTLRDLFIPENATAPISLFGGGETPVDTFFLEILVRVYGHRVAVNTYCGPA